MVPKRKAKKAPPAGEAAPEGAAPEAPEAATEAAPAKKLKKRRAAVAEEAAVEEAQAEPEGAPVAGRKRKAAAAEKTAGKAAAGKEGKAFKSKTGKAAAAKAAAKAAAGKAAKEARPQLAPQSSATERLRAVLDSARANAFLRLNQACMLLGWRHRSFLAEGLQGWTVEVAFGRGEQRAWPCFKRYGDHKKGEKQGKEAAATAALEDLEPRLRRALAEPPESLEGLVGGTWRRLAADAAGWKALRAAQGDAVAVCVSGFLQGSLPALVSVAAGDCVLMELPRAAGGPSEELRRLLDDAAVTKVLGSNVGFSGQSTVALEELAKERLGESQVRRGAARTLLMAQGRERLVAPGDYGAWEAFRPPEAGKSGRLEEFPEESLRAAQLEVQGTLLAWRALTQLEPIGAAGQGEAEEKEVAAKEAEAKEEVKEEAKEKKKKKRKKAEKEEGAGESKAAEDAEMAELNRELAELEGQLDELPAKEKWRGWGAALDMVLFEAGGELSWPELCQRLVQRRLLHRIAPGYSEGQLRLQALACIPDAYLSEDSSVVTLPDDVEFKVPREQLKGKMKRRAHNAWQQAAATAAREESEEAGLKKKAVQHKSKRARDRWKRYNGIPVEGDDA